jgi:CBS-domain-containing membrane protein
MRPFGTGESEIASYDLAALMRRVERRRMERERRELARRERWSRIVRWLKGVR